MAYILDIFTAVPQFSFNAEESVKFLSQSARLTADDHKKLRFLSNRSRITRRYSCIPDFNGIESELYKEENYKQPLEKRMELYTQKLMPMAIKAVDGLLHNSKIPLSSVTHLIAVSCTGLMAPGFEFMIAEKYGLHHTEKTAVNFLGCYAGLKALKQADYIARANTKACVLIVCAELCTLHYYPSSSNEDLVAYLLFGDGAAASFVCGEHSPLLKNRTSLKINDSGTAYIPNSASLMTWNITSSAFRMFLSSDVVEAIKRNIADAVSGFLPSDSEIDHWAIHPGGIKIVEAVQQELDLSDKEVEDSVHVLQQYGNMSSGTILFILHRVLSKIRAGKTAGSQNIFACAFGPGLNIEMMNLSSEHAYDVKPDFTNNPNVEQKVAPGGNAG